jgi:hypothetical protein
MSLRRALLVLVALALTAPATAAGAQSVLYVGDSLGFGTMLQLRASITRPYTIDADTRIGRPSSEGLAILRSMVSARHQVVVFDLGTNDASPQLLGRNLRRARGLTGHRQLIVFTLNKPGAQPFNAVIRRFTRSADAVSLIDWHATAETRHLLGGDGIHASESGYRRRAALVMSVIRADRRAQWRSSGQ